MTNREKSQARIRIYLVVIVGLLTFLGYEMYSYWPKIYANYKEKSELQKQYNELLDQENTLSGDIKKLQDPNYIARFAREKYLYSKNGEIIIRIVD